MSRIKFKSPTTSLCVLIIYFCLCGLCLNVSECLRISFTSIQQQSQGQQNKQSIINNSDNNNSSTTATGTNANNTSVTNIKSEDKTQAVTFINAVGDSSFNSSVDLAAFTIYHKGLNLTCEGSENDPIEWVYEGGGGPSKVIERARREGSRIVSQLTFETTEKSRDYSQHTGKYVCRSLQNHSSNASIYIYFPGHGSKVFVGDKEEDVPEVLYLTECVDPTLTKTTNPNLQLEVEVKDGVKPLEFSGCPKLVIPCLITTPSANVSLFRKTYEGDLEPLNLPYNPQLGFSLELDPAYKSNPDYYYSLAGEYLCIASTSQPPSSSRSREDKRLKSKLKMGSSSRRRNSNSNSTFVASEKPKIVVERNVTKIFYVYPPKIIKPTPPDSIVYIGQTINLTCESDVPVIIKESEFHLPSYFDESGSSEPQIQEEAEADDPEVEETTETIPLNKHVANYIDTNPVAGSYGEFQCLAEAPDSSKSPPKVLHVWKYFVIGKEADEKSGIRYSKRKKSFSCRSKSNQPGYLSYIHCESPSECSINRVCLQNSNSCRGYKSPVGHSNRCKSPKSCKEFLHFGGSGYLRCTGELIEEVKRFDETGPLDTEETEGETQLLGLKSNDALEAKYHPLTLKSYNYSHSEDKNSTVLKFQVKLKRSRFHFLDGNVWTLRVGKKSGSVDNDATAQGIEIQVQPESSNRLSNHESEYAFETVLNGTLRNPIEIECKVPLRSSMDWKIVSVLLPPIPEPQTLTLSVTKDTNANNTKINSTITAGNSTEIKDVEGKDTVLPISTAVVNRGEENETVSSATESDAAYETTTIFDLPSL